MTDWLVVLIVVCALGTVVFANLRVRHYERAAIYFEQLYRNECRAHELTRTERLLRVEAEADFNSTDMYVFPPKDDK